VDGSGIWAFRARIIVCKEPHVAKLPSALIKPTPRKVSDLKPGESSLFPLYVLHVGLDYEVAVNPGTDLPPPIDEKFEYGEIRRDEKGRLHLDLKHTRHQWRPEDLSGFLKYGSYQLVESVTWTEPPAKPAE
jgi:hypothetical protein